MCLPSCGNIIVDTHDLREDGEKHSKWLCKLCLGLNVIDLLPTLLFSNFPSIFLSFYLSFYLCVDRSIYLSINSYLYLHVYLFFYIYIYILNIFIYVRTYI